jgi:hypothetical protein
VGIETVGMETLGRLDGSHPDTLPVTLENIPPAAFVGLFEGGGERERFIGFISNAIIGKFVRREMY